MKCKCILVSKSKDVKGIISTEYNECQYCKNLRKEYENEYHKNLVDGLGVNK